MLKIIVKRLVIYVNTVNYVLSMLRFINIKKSLINLQLSKLDRSSFHKDFWYINNWYTDT